MKIRLMFGDCLERMKELPDKLVDCVITDLPYGTTKCKWDIIIPFEKMWEQINRVVKDDGVIALFGIEPFSSCLRMSNLKNYKYDWIWDKITARGHLVAKKRPMNQTENISMFQNKIPFKYYPQMVDRPIEKIKKQVIREYSRTEIMGGNKSTLNPKIYDKWYPKNIIQCSNASSSVKSIHPTQKPVTLLEYLIKTYTLEGEIILDFTMGVASTGIASMNLNRNFVGIENDKNFFQLAKQRIMEKQVK